MITVNIDITTKKGHTVKTTWGIEQEAVYPSLTQAHSLRWQGADAILGTYRTKPTGIGEAYRFALLRSDRAPVADAMRDRSNYAGYKADERQDEANPGAFELRGASLGEITGTFTGKPWPQFSVRVRGHGHATDGERAFLESAIAPALRAAAEANKAQLKAEAIAAIRLHVATTIADMRERLTACEAEMTKAIDAL